VPSSVVIAFRKQVLEASRALDTIYRLSSTGRKTRVADKPRLVAGVRHE